MAETLEESLRSILDQLNEEFEVLVVDDNSTDGSQQILERLEDEYTLLRWIDGDNDNIGEARAQANEEARGEYILVQFDMDEKYKHIILDLVKIYHKVEDNREDEFFMGNMGSKSLLTEINYRSLGRGEDRDFWRRLTAADSKIELETESYSNSIGYDYDKIEHLKNGYETTKNLFRSGVTWQSFVKYKLEHLKYRDDLFRIFISTIAYFQARIEGVYGLPEYYEKFGKYHEKKSRNTYTLPELEKKYNFEVKTDLSEVGKEVFYMRE